MESVDLRGPALQARPAAEPGLDVPATGLGDAETRLTQQQVESGVLSLLELRRAGMRVFATPFTKVDGYADGPMNPADPISPGGRPTLLRNGTSLRVNGLDSQTCVECHAGVSTATVPFTFGIGGAGTQVSLAMFQPRRIDVEDTAGARMASFDGRPIILSHLFGLGAVQLLAKEMTTELQGLLRAYAIAHPETPVRLKT